MLNKPITLEDEVEEKILIEDIKEIIDSLPDIQKRRLKKYYFEDKTTWRRWLQADFSPNQRRNFRRP